MKIISDIIVILSEKDLVHVKKMMDTVNKFRKENKEVSLSFNTISCEAEGAVRKEAIIHDHFKVLDRHVLIEAARSYDDAALIVDGSIDITVSNYARYIMSSGTDHPKKVRSYNEKENVSSRKR